MLRTQIRYIYKAVSLLLIVSSSFFSTFIFRLMLWVNQVDYGHNVRTMKSVPDLVINRTARVHIGNNVVFNNKGDHSWYCKCKIMVRPKARLFIGNDVGMNGVLIFCSNNIIIKNHVKIGGGTRITDTNHHSLNYIERRKDATDNAISKPISIEEDVFIGTDCYIGKGVSIGARSIIAAGSVVVKSIPQDCIAGGNPCRVIRYL